MSSCFLISTTTSRVEAGIVCLEPLTGVQGSKTNNRQTASNGSKCRQGSWNAENTHCEAYFDEHNSGTLPADGSEFYTIDLRLEDLTTFPYLRVGDKIFSIW